MKLILNVAPGLSPLTVEDVDDFKRFGLTVVGGDYEAAKKRLTPFGRFIDQQTAAVSPDIVKQLSGKSSDPVWVAGFEAMLFYAHEAGWIDSETEGIMAHCDWVSVR